MFYTKLEELMERGTEERESIEAVAFLLCFFFFWLSFHLHVNTERLLSLNVKKKIKNGFNHPPRSSRWINWRKRGHNCQGFTVLLIAGQHLQQMTLSFALWDWEFYCIFTASCGISKVQCMRSCPETTSLEMALYVCVSKCKTAISLVLPPP